MFNIEGSLEGLDTSGLCSRARTLDKFPVALKAIIRELQNRKRKNDREARNFLREYAQGN